MQESAVTKTPEGAVGETGKQDYQTPEIYDVSSLRIDTKLPEIKIKSGTDTIFSNLSSIEVTIELPKKISGADIFLFNNGKKQDMYYQVDAGEYSFHKIFLDDSVNNLIFFYRLGNRRSLPEKLVVIKEFK